MTPDARALRQRIISHFAKEYLDDDTLVGPDLLVGTNPDGALALNLVDGLNAMANVAGVDLVRVIAKLRKLVG